MKNKNNIYSYLYTYSTQKGNGIVMCKTNVYTTKFLKKNHAM